MNYYTIQGSCLLSIMIPLSLAIQEYALWLKENGWSKYKWKLHICTCMIVGIIICYLNSRALRPYLPFVTGGATVLALTEGNFFVKKQPVQKEPYNQLELVIKYIGIVKGVGIIIAPHTSIFYENILSDCVNEVVVMCDTIYTLFGIECIVFRMVDLYRDKKRFAHYIR